MICSDSLAEDLNYRKFCGIESNFPNSEFAGQARDIICICKQIVVIFVVVLTGLLSGFRN